MPKPKKPRYILELDLNTELFHEHILEKRMEIGRKLFNACKSMLMKQIRLMRNNADYKDCLLQEKSELRSEKLKEIRESFDVSKTGAERLIKEMGTHFLSKKKSRNSKQKVHLDSHTVQKIAEDVWQSCSDYLFGKAKKVHFKKYGQFNSLESKTNKSGIRYVGGMCLFNGLEIPVSIDKNDRYAHDALHDEIAFCRIVRKIVRGKAKYYLQLVLKGVPPIKKHATKTGDVGLDIGISTLASVSDSCVSIVEFCEKIKPLQREKRRLQRKLDRSRRATNPCNFHPNGVVKKGCRKWVRSNNYMKTLFKLKEMERKLAAKRKIEHNKTANVVLSMGDNVFCEKINFKGLQKSIFGKRIGFKAPSMFLTILNNKLAYQNKSIQYINTWTAKASQYDPHSDTYAKKRLSERFHTTGDGKIIQRDCFSAFLIKNIDASLQKIDRTKCLKEFNGFYVNYQKTEMQLMQNAKKKPMLSSIGF